MLMSYPCQLKKNQSIPVNLCNLVIVLAFSLNLGVCRIASDYLA